MARSPANGEGSATEATTLIFPKKSAWEELLEAKRQAKKRASSANGTYSKVVARLVEEEHVDRRAARMLCSLDQIEDDADLHVTLHHLIDGLKKTGLMKRALAQEEMFDDNKIDETVTAAAGKGKNRKKHPGVNGDELPANVTQIGDAARKVTEAAGTA